MGGRQEGVLVRLSPEILEMIDARVKEGPDGKLTRPAVIRSLVAIALGLPSEPTPAAPRRPKKTPPA